MLQGSSIMIKILKKNKNFIHTFFPKYFDSIKPFLATFVLGLDNCPLDKYPPVRNLVNVMLQWPIFPWRLIHDCGKPFPWSWQ